MKKRSINTGFKDDQGNPIFVGNTLLCRYGYKVIVKKDKNGFYGKLVCDQISFLR